MTDIYGQMPLQSIESAPLLPWQFVNYLNTNYNGAELFNKTRYSIAIFLIISHFLCRKFKCACMQTHGAIYGYLANMHIRRA